MMLAPDGRPSLSLTTDGSDNTTVDFTVGPNGGVFYAGNNAVVFPARSICDPATSSYGDDTWDSPCTPLKGAMRIHAVVRTVNGTSTVDFTPSIRFVPSNDPSRWVWLYMRTPGARNSSGDLSRFNILYFSTLDGATTDEARLDTSMRTYVDTRSGVSARRIKHFSGYTTSW